jgi:predicted nucleic acid-binding protein
LTSDFPVVLADALDRVLFSKKGVVAVLTANTDFTTAEAS